MQKNLLNILLKRSETSEDVHHVSSSFDPFGEVVIMEDVVEIEEKMKKAIEDILGPNVFTASSADEVVERAETNQTKNFIIDIKMGKYKAHEGLNALERLKKINNNIFVCLYSGFPQLYQDYARKLEADIFKEKSGDVEKDIQEILVELMKYRIDMIRNQLENARSLLSHLEPTHKSMHKSETSLPDEDNTDVNIKSYNLFISDKNWFTKYLDCYVAFVDGVLIGSDKDKNKLLDLLYQEYPMRARLVKKVEINKKYFDVSSPLSITHL